MTRLQALHLDPTTYRRHALHADDRAWVEKNCYFDIWIEVIHALGCEPLAMVPVVAAIDFEGDQWTFFKPSHDELRELYGLNVQELNCWRPLVEHAVEHVGAGRLLATEADAWWLPDVAGTDYRTQHTKSTIVIADIDLPAKRLGYFHNAGYFELSGEDFDRTLRLDEHGRPIVDPAFLPLFAELVRLDRVQKRPADELRELSSQLLRKHLARRTHDNPISRFATRFEHDLPMLQEKGLAHYHAWAFATLRQLGAAAELMAHYLRWLGGRSGTAIEAYDAISSGAKAFILKAARAVNNKKPLDASATFAEWADAWAQAMRSLEK
jgi:hypothetical protein